MGMYDSVIGPDGTEWQTKALSRSLQVYRIGDSVPIAPADEYQMAVIGGPVDDKAVTAFVIVRDSTITAIEREPDPSLRTLGYLGDWRPARAANPKHAPPGSCRT